MTKNNNPTNVIAPIIIPIIATTFLWSIIAPTIPNAIARTAKINPRMRRTNATLLAIDPSIGNEIIKVIGKNDKIPSISETSPNLYFINLIFFYSYLFLFK